MTDLEERLDQQVREAYSDAERKLLPAPLLREREFYQRVGLLVGLLYCVPWLYFGFKSFAVLNHGPLWENWPAIWRMGARSAMGS